MSDGLKLIGRLEEEMGIELKQVSMEKIGHWKVNGFAADNEGRVRGLAIWEKKLSPLPEYLSKFQNLEILALNKTQISDISSLKKLKGLKVLYLYINQISDISSLKELKMLTFLHLSNNQISDVSSLKELKNLKRLYLIGNKISYIPAEFLDMGMDIKWGLGTQHEGIYLADNPLESPPVEIIKKGNQAIREYFNSLAEKSQALNEVKVLLVGDGAAGKTSLMKQLMGKPFDKKESQTHGININTLAVSQKNSKIKARLWDFGGQEIMHATHRFFLSKRSLYILVLDGRKDEKTEYWLNHIKSFGGDSPVLLVLNKIDQNSGFDVNRKFLSEKYPNIRGYFPVSCATGEGMEDFTTAFKQALDAVEIKSTIWGRAWFKVKECLENMQDSFISYREYRGICTDCEVPEDSGRETLVEFLNDLGVIVHFKDLELNDTHILQPSWVTEAAYRIINSPHLSKGKGILALNRLPDILKKRRDEEFDCPPEKYRYIISLMRKFELCYQLDEQRILVPGLLDTTEPGFEYDTNGEIRFIVQYEFMPPSVMPRFIVKMHKDIYNGLQWRTGVVLRDTDYQTSAVVKADIEAKRIYIHVNGQQKRDYFAVLLTVLRSINHDFEILKTTELVPMPDDPGITADYDQLIRHEQHGIPVFLPGNSDKTYNVKDLLGSIAIDKRSDDELVLLIKKALREDNEESSLEKVNSTMLDVLSFRPKFLGLEMDVNALLKKLRGKNNR